MSLQVFLNLIRYKNYIKNFIIFLPLFLNFTNWNQDSYIELIIPYIFFCIISSSIYIINDLKDLELDKTHKTKKFRPLPSGIVSKKVAILISIFFAFSSFLYFGLFSLKKVLILILAYFFINIFYSFYIKKIKYLDLISISSGFIIRIFLGSFISSVFVSKFLIMQIVFFSLFILICKRREYFFSYNKPTKFIYKLNELNFLSKLFLFLSILNYFIYIFSSERFTDSLSIEFSFLIFSYLIVKYYLNTKKNINFDPITIYFNDRYLIFFSFIYILNFISGFYALY